MLQLYCDTTAPGSYRITEQSVPEPYVIGDEPTKTITLNPGDEKEVIFENLKKLELTISKIDADTGEPIPGTVFTVKALDGDYQDDWTTGADGKVSQRVAPGTYQITEKSVPAPYYLPDKDADRVQTITLNPGDEKTVLFRNHKAPELTIYKEDSVAGAPIKGAKFHITFTSNGESAEAPASFDYGYAEHEENVSCREMIEDNIAQIGEGVASDALRHRFFLIFQYEAGMRAKRNTTAGIIQRLNEEADTARRYLDMCELEVLEPPFSDDFILKLLYEIINKRASQRVKLPEGVFDMTTTVHGIFEG